MPEEREAIAAAGRAEAVGRHTYRHRMERLLAEAERRTGRTAVRPGGGGGRRSGGLVAAPRRGEAPSSARGTFSPVGRRGWCELRQRGSVVERYAAEAEGEAPSSALRAPSPRRGEGEGRASAGRGRLAEGKLGPAGPDGRGRPAGSADGGGLASVIVPCWNQCAFTRQCLQALFRFTRPGSWELIVVDNGSTDGTADYLAGVRDATSVPVTVITNPCNIGFPAAVNQGLQVAGGEYLVLLNNDAVVTEGWLEQLIALTSARSSSPVARGSTASETGRRNQGIWSRAERSRADPLTPTLSPSGRGRSAGSTATGLALGGGRIHSSARG